MENKQVLTEDELNQLKEIQEMYSKIVLELGKIDIKIDELETNISQLTDQKKMILKEYNSLQIRENILGQELSNKYGDGVVDPISGEFTPSN